MTQLVFATFGTGCGWVKDRKQRYLELAYSLQCHNVLATKAQISEIHRCIEYGRMHPKQINFWLDSGAFTAWTKNRDFSVTEYYDFIQEIRPQLKCFRKVFVISLDSIPGKYGKKPTKDEVLRSIEYTIKNTEYLIQKGVNAIPVHHQGEPPEVILHYKSIAEYVGLSPANDSHQNLRVAYLQRMLQYFKPDDEGFVHPCHNFGNTTPKQLKVFPFFSADSATWKAAASQFGREFSVDIVKGARQKTTKVSSLMGRHSFLHCMADAIKQTKKYESDLIKLWKIRGISWKEPQGLNIDD